MGVKKSPKVHIQKKKTQITNYYACGKWGMVRTKKSESDERSLSLAQRNRSV